MEDAIELAPKKDAIIESKAKGEDEVVLNPNIEDDMQSMKTEEAVVIVGDESVVNVDEFVDGKLEEETAVLLKSQGEAAKLNVLTPDCEHCGKKMLSKKGLIMHIRRKHREVKQYKCALCGKEFRKKRGARDHTSMSHQSRAAPIWLSTTMKT